MNLIELKNQLSEELKKPKRQRDYDLINNLHENINQEKTTLTKNFRNRQKEKLSESTKKKQVLDAKKSAQYKKIRAERKKELAKKK